MAGFFKKKKKNSLRCLWRRGGACDVKKYSENLKSYCSCKYWYNSSLDYCLEIIIHSASQWAIIMCFFCFVLFCFLLFQCRLSPTIFAWSYCWSSIQPAHGKMVRITKATSKGSGEPAHKRCHARAFAVRRYVEGTSRMLQVNTHF